MDNAPETGGQCTATTASGSRCKQVASTIGGLCIWHDPDRAEEAAAARERGRMAQRKPVITLDDLEPALAESPDLELTLDGLSYYLAWCLRQTTGGRMDPDRLKAITPAVTGIRTALTARELARQVREAQREIKRLKAELAKQAPVKEAWE